MLYIALLCIAVSVYWLWMQRKVRSDEPPYLPGAWPIIGHIPSLVGDICKLWTYANTAIDQIHSLGGAVRIKLGPKTLYVICNPTDILTIANTCLEKPYVYDFLKPLWGDALITGPASTWKIHRNLLNPAFNQSVLDTFTVVFNNQARKLVKDLKNEVGKGLFDHAPYTKICSIETICYTALGADINDSRLKNNYIENLDTYLHCVTERGMKFWWHDDKLYRFSKLKKKEDASVKVLHDLTNSILLQKESNYGEQSSTEESLKFKESKFKSYIEILLELSHKGVFSDKEVIDHTNTIIAAGADTVVESLTFILLLLGAHTEVQEKVVAEANEIFANDDREIEKKDFSQLVYLEAVIKESLRLYSVVPAICRQIDKDIKLSNCTLYAGYICVMFLQGAHQDPSWGSDRHQFRPERWLDRAQLLANHNILCAFGIGKRSCIGQAYAYMFMKTVIVHFLRHYKISADMGQLQNKFGISLKPVSGHFISIENRID